MKKLMVVLGIFGAVLSGYGQGTVLLSNLGGGVDAPILYFGSPSGPGPDFSAQLYLVGANNSLTALAPITTFRPAGTTPQTAIADRYLDSTTVEVPGVAPGSAATFLIRAWRTSLGSFEGAKVFGTDYGESNPVTITLGGGTLPPANLIGLQAFTLSSPAWPEPSALALGALGAAVFLLGRGRR